jgi:octaheme c-type cytochrome (tetrathionate reductase family)
MTPSERPHRVTKPFFTFGTLTLLILMGIGFSFGITRLFLGLGAVTNLDNHNPWGIWIAFDVACGVALAAGGFVTAALVEVFGRHRYRALLRPALLTAFLGYLWVAIALLFDLGRYWNAWRPLVNWQGNSVLFEVGMCVSFYLVVLTVEMSPSILEGLEDRMHENGRAAAFLRRLERPVHVVHSWVRIVLPIFIVAGVVLSFMHQSSLGTLMLIAPTKTSSLWDTSILPVLFLLSALMVGFPMVILESIYANLVFGRKAEMNLLTPLAKLIPWFIGVYLVVKLGDLAVRFPEIDLLENPGATVSLAVEILIGSVAPFILLLNRAVRRSIGWLFFAVSLVIFGVVLNRINVFLVGYQPPFAVERYFPSVGEIAMTVAIVSSILFCYRLLVTFFPILPGYVPPTQEERRQAREERLQTVSPGWSWAIRGTAVAVLASFVVTYFLVHQAAVHATERTVQQVERVTAAEPVHLEVAAASYPQRPMAYRNFYLLDNPILNDSTDDYEPVAFAHRIHDEITAGDCGVCHHRYSWDDDDRIGEDLDDLHAMMDIVLSGPCQSCHEDMADNPPQACGRCHGLPNEADSPARIGLKGAYHRQCMGCHERDIQPAPAPTECDSCHHPWTPDHGPLVALADRPSPQDVTAACLECHAAVGEDLLETAHWNWCGQSPPLAGYQRRTGAGLPLMVNNYCVAIGADPESCANCHIGYGRVDDGFDFENPVNLDCLICHDTTGTYSKDTFGAGLPPAELDLAAVAEQVGRPTRKSCGSCHFASGGGPNAKHGDLEPALEDPPPGFDQHMGILDMRCQDCHSTRHHRIAGMSMTAPAVEGRVHCEQCHSPTPHGVVGMLGQHLDDHVRSVACETCHIPTFARSSPTLLHRDLSAAGHRQEAGRDEFGMPTHDPRFGTLVWGVDQVPAYLWWNGNRHATRTGDRIQPRRGVVLNAPAGEKRDPTARIHPFKAHTAIQPYDTATNVLAVTRLSAEDWGNFDWDRSIREGMQAMGLEYSGSYGWVETTLYTGIHHGVVPAADALGCTDCHSTQAANCVRCHRGAEGMDRPEHTRRVYPESPRRLDFEALGYPDDPALTGGRFYFRLGRGLPPE